MRREELLNLIPEFNLIQDDTLRQNTVSVWQEAATAGGWNAAEIVRLPFTLAGNHGGIMYIEHVRTVCKMCLACDEVLEHAYGARRTPVNRDYLITGALLADVGKLLEYEKRDDQFCTSKHGRYLRHPFTGVGLCFKHNIPDEVVHMVAVHSREGDEFPRSAEAIILHHVDFIDFELAGIS